MCFCIATLYHFCSRKVSWIIQICDNIKCVNNEKLTGLYRRVRSRLTLIIILLQSFNKGGNVCLFAQRRMACSETIQEQINMWRLKARSNPALYSAFPWFISLVCLLGISAFLQSVVCFRDQSHDVRRDEGRCWDAACNVLFCVFTRVEGGSQIH